MSLTASRALADFLLDINREADVAGWGDPVTLLLIHTQHTDLGDAPITYVEFPLHPHDQPTRPDRLPPTLRRLTAALTDPTGRTPYQATLTAILDRILTRQPTAMLLAWAAVYHDRYRINGQPRHARRITAVGRVGRLYQITHPHAGQPVLFVIPDLPEPADPDTVHHGLAALLTTSSRHASHQARHRPTPPTPQGPDDPHAPIFIAGGPENSVMVCGVCGAHDGITHDEMPSMAGYGHDTHTRCGRCGSTETTDPVFGLHTTRSPWPTPGPSDHADGEVTP
ncbi:hypothetical protein [Micromonospora fluostatini]|uniref:hypothetical protein n=1 Tax=Micromonospora sp. JCM 30529 TaxID=3421643 RepID=UPI003D17BDEC